MEYILAAAAGLFLVLFVFSTILAVRRRTQVQQSEKHLGEHRRQVRELEERLEGKSRQVEQLGSQLDRSRDEAKKAKKKAHELEKRGRDSRPSEDTELDRIQEEALQEARTQSSRAREEASQASDECVRLREQVDQLKKEIQEARATLSSRQADDSRGQKESTQQLKQLQKENRDLKKKLEAAKRKARTDSQVYKVTKSKLELAMEKIQVLEKNAKSGSGATAARPTP
jgi:peptidoglycan hydrolase CwlO-like protein